MRSWLFGYELTHHRVRPARHEFGYSAPYFWLDLHCQALQLWRRGVPSHAHPGPAGSASQEVRP